MSDHDSSVEFGTPFKPSTLIRRSPLRRKHSLEGVREGLEGLSICEDKPEIPEPTLKLPTPLTGSPPVIVTPPIVTPPVSSTTSSFVPNTFSTFPTNIMSSPTFHGKGAKQEDPEEYIETIELNATRYENELREAVCRSTFREGLKGRAKEWYGPLDREVRRDWSALKAAFISEFSGDSAPTYNERYIIMHQVTNLKRMPQEPMVEYVRRARQIHSRCDADAKQELAFRLLTGMRDDALQSKVQCHLMMNQKLAKGGGLRPDTTFADVQDAIVVSSTLLGKPSPFDSLLDQNQELRTVEPLTSEEVTRQLLNLTTIIASNFGMRGQSPGQPAQIPTTPAPAYEPTAPPPNPFLATSGTANPGGILPIHTDTYDLRNIHPERASVGMLSDRKPGKPATHNPTHNPRVTCFNCEKIGHISTNCPEERRPYAETRAFREKYEMERNGSGLSSMNPSASIPVTATVQQAQQASGATAQVFRGGHDHPAFLPEHEATGANATPLGSKVASVATLVKHSKIQRNVCSAPTAVEACSCRECDFHVAMPAQATTSRHATATRNQASGAGYEHRLRERAKATLDLMEQDQEEPRNNGSQETQAEEPRNNGSQETQATMEAFADNQGGEPEVSIQGRQESRRPTFAPLYQSHPNERIDVGQRKTAATGPSTQPKKDKDTIPIRIIKAGQLKRYDIADTLCGWQVHMSMAQLLDRSPQIRTQLVRYLQSDKPLRRPKRRTAQVATAQVMKVLDEGFDEDTGPISCMYIRAFVKGVQVDRTMVDSGAVIELISPGLVKRIGLHTLQMDKKWSLKLANDIIVPITQYTLIPLNVEGIQTICRAYVMGESETYELLLSKNWLRRVRAVEDHGRNTLVISGRNGKKANVTITQATPFPDRVVELREEEDGGSEEDLAYDGGGSEAEEDWKGEGLVDRCLEELVQEVEEEDEREYQAMHKVFGEEVDSGTELDGGKAMRQ